MDSARGLTHHHHEHSTTKPRAAEDLRGAYRSRQSGAAKALAGGAPKVTDVSVRMMSP